MKNLFPTVMVVISIAAAFTYLFYKDYARFAYWLSAAALTTSTLFM